MPWSWFFECWVLTQPFHSPLSLLSRGSFVPLSFCHKGGVICISEVIDISPSNLDSSLCFIQLAFHMIYSAYRASLVGSDDKESACNAGNLGLIPGLGRSPGGGHGNPPHYFCLENPHRQRSLVGYIPWGCKESDTAKQLSTHTHTHTHTLHIS